MSNLVLLGSNQDGLFLEKGFPVFGLKKHAAAINETDLDILFEYRWVEIKQESAETLFSTDTFLFIEETGFQGYVRLRIVSPALNGNSTPVYFSGKAFKQRLLFHLDESGYHVRKYDHKVVNESPALRGNIDDELGTHDLDYVAAITMDDWPKLAEAFITRDRPSDWPAPDIITEIVSKGCRFVATAHNSCKKDNYQWIVSFAASEQILSRSLNNSQFRAFLFFKTMFQLFLSDPECLSSYMMKNVLFWTIELLPSIIWNADNILYCLESLVDMLCTFLDRQIIQNFFLPNQNLIGHIEKSLVAELAKKAHDIQNDVLGMVIKCTEVPLFQGQCAILLNLMHSKLLAESDESNSLISMACFSSYLYLRLQAIRYIFQLPFVTDECFTRGCRSLCAAIPPRAVWYCSKALQIQPLGSLRFYRRHDTWELDISCMRKQVVQFWRSPVYTGIFKSVFSDQEFVTNKHIDTIPEFDLFVNWVDLTSLWSGLEGIKHGNSQYFITVD